MREFRVIAALAALMFIPSFAASAASPFAGRWDITVTTPKATYPDWMELVEDGGNPRVRVQPRGGSVHPATNVHAAGSRLTLTLSKASARRPEVTWELTVSGDRIKGVEKHGGTVAGQLAGVRAPLLDRKPPRAWTNPEPLFDGKDLAGWEPIGSAKNNWVVQDGVLVNEAHGANLRTTRKFNDFKLHIEYNCPSDGNSGIYLRGRYELQIEYQEVDAGDKFHEVGSIYGFLAPSVELPRKPGTWESLDITLVGRKVTVVRNGTTTIDNQEIPGITGGALDSAEGEPGPFYIQGDHTGGMKYRNITIELPKR